MQKNIAGKWVVFAFDDTDNTPVTGDAANITANLRIDGGAANATDDINPTELEDGYYIFDITAAEANGDNLLLSPQSSTVNTQVIGVPGAVWTRPPNFEALGINASGDVAKVTTTTTNADMRGTDSAATASALATVNTNVDSILVDTGTTLPDSIAVVDGNVDAILVDTDISIPALITSLNDVAATDIVSAGAISTLSGAVVNVDTVDVTTTNTDMRGTDGANTAVPPSVAAIADGNWDEPTAGHTSAGTFGAQAKTVIDQIVSDTNELQSDDVPGLIAALNDITTAEVKAQIVAGLSSDTYGEPGQGAPPSTASLVAKVNYLFKAWRNKSEMTSTTYSLFNDAGVTVDHKATVSDSGTTASKGEVATGP